MVTVFQLIVNQNFHTNRGISTEIEVQVPPEFFKQRMITVTSTGIPGKRSLEQFHRRCLPTCRRISKRIPAEGLLLRKTLSLAAPATAEPLKFGVGNSEGRMKPGAPLRRGQKKIASEGSLRFGGACQDKITR
jgi:hypothetical protein